MRLLMTAPDPKNFPKPRIGPEPHLDRRAEKRGNTHWIASQRRAPESRYLLLADLSLCVISDAERTRTAIRWYSAEALEALGGNIEESLFLGTDTDDRAIFAHALSPGDISALPGGLDGIKPAVDLRSLATQGVMPYADLALFAMARGLAAWHLSARCCGRCGSHTNVGDAGWRRSCWACGQTHFPRADPAVIVLISDGSRCLLGHHKRYAHKFYSTLAGFVEPGEDFEATVRREMREETGVEIGEVTYLASQPWPFPHSLMLGCWAEAVTTELTLDPEELWDARWFTRDDVRAMIDERHPDGFTVPGPHSIAYCLIKSFLDQG